VQKELQEERQVIKNFVQGDALLYLAHYIEKVETGTLDMIERCREAGLPEPDFEQRADQFVVTLWRDWLTDKVMSDMGLNRWQKEAVAYLKAHAQITNSEYQKTTDVSRVTASRDLDMLVNRGVLKRVGTTGKGTHYVLTKKRITNVSNASKEARQKPGKPDIPRGRHWKQLINGSNGLYGLKGECCLVDFTGRGNNEELGLPVGYGTPARTAHRFTAPDPVAHGERATQSEPLPRRGPGRP